jgi:hypothetical protein
MQFSRQNILQRVFVPLILLFTVTIVASAQSGAPATLRSSERDKPDPLQQNMKVIEWLMEVVADRDSFCRKVEQYPGHTTCSYVTTAGDSYTLTKVEALGGFFRLSYQSSDKGSQKEVSWDKSTRDLLAVSIIHAGEYRAWNNKQRSPATILEAERTVVHRELCANFARLIVGRVLLSVPEKK